MSFSVKVKVRLRIIVKMRSVRSDPEEMVFERKEKYRAEEKQQEVGWQREDHRKTQMGVDGKMQNTKGGRTNHV